MGSQNILLSLWDHLPGLTECHLLVFSTLLGTELYQSFVMTKVCYQALPRSAFTTLQKKIFPIYFQSQSLLLVFTAISLPPHGPFSLFTNKTDWIPLLIAGVTAGLNLVTYGPRTRKLMIERIHQDTRDGLAQQAHSTAGLNKEKQALSRAFSRAHAMSIHLNLVTIGASLWYGLRLASRLNPALNS
ncbi:hypothetical protein B0J11DRAFT_538681 [Dendryphion nanum]|uniref:TMEM205-like domain-containing protein n=1 Tax=Dendryphion nanum TaxID=256645 RepID=A0A9P9D8V7_9PLEO|nr:hypothetical protein B0J11DRAFT_538681 [Dendryphion nanum]